MYRLRVVSVMLIRRLTFIAAVVYCCTCTTKVMHRINPLSECQLTDMQIITSQMHRLDLRKYYTLDTIESPRKNLSLPRYTNCLI